MYKIETNTESRSISIKSGKIYRDVYSTTYNTIIITSDDKCILCIRNGSYYIPEIINIVNTYIIDDRIKNIKKRLFVQIFNILSVTEKFKLIYNNPKIKNYIVNNNLLKSKYNYMWNNNSNVYMLPGGKRLKNESPFDTIKREASEELGIDNLNLYIYVNYYAEILIYDKILCKSFKNITTISRTPLNSNEIYSSFKHNSEVSDIIFVDLKYIIYNFDRLIKKIQYTIVTNKNQINGIKH